MSTPAEKRGLLLDTSFILPLFGVDMGPRVAETLRRVEEGCGPTIPSLVEAVFALIREA